MKAILLLALALQFPVIALSGDENPIAACTSSINSGEFPPTFGVYNRDDRDEPDAAAVIFQSND